MKGGEAWDDARGGELRVKDVRKAHREEVGFMQGRGIWEERSVEEWRRKTGKAPISVRCADTNKGTQLVPDVRSRLVARDFKNKMAKGEEGGVKTKTACSHPRRHWRR